MKAFVVDFQEPAEFIKTYRNFLKRNRFLLKTKVSLSTDERIKIRFNLPDGNGVVLGARVAGANDDFWELVLPENLDSHWLKDRGEEYLRRYPIREMETFPAEDTQTGSHGITEELTDVIGFKEESTAPDRSALFEAGKAAQGAEKNRASAQQRQEKSKAPVLEGSAIAEAGRLAAMKLDGNKPAAAVAEVKPSAVEQPAAPAPVPEARKKPVKRTRAEEEKEQRDTRPIQPTAQKRSADPEASEQSFEGAVAESAGGSPEGKKGEKPEKKTSGAAFAFVSNPSFFQEVPKGGARPSDMSGREGEPAKPGENSEAAKADDGGGAGPEVSKKLVERISAMSASQRKQVAISAGPRERAILILDKDPSIHLWVLKNPELTEAEVRRISSMQTLSKEAIDFLLATRKWMTIPTVALNLLLHPLVPEDAHGRLLTVLPSKVLMALSQRPGISKKISDAAKQLLVDRKDF